MKRRVMNKKGSLLDVIFIAIILLVLSVTTIICFKIYDEIDTQFQAHEGIPTQGKVASSQMRAHFPGILDNSFLFITVSLALLAFVLAALVRVHPIFFVFFIIILGIVIFISAIFSNVYQEIASDSEFTTLADELNFTSIIMTYLPFIIGVFGTVLSIVMYKLWSAEQF